MIAKHQFKLIDQTEITFSYNGYEYERVKTIFISPKDGLEKTSIYWGIPIIDRNANAEYIEEVDNSLLEKEYQQYIRTKKLERLTNEENY